MTITQKAFYASILVLALATAATATVGQYRAEKQLDNVRTILTK
jgi:Na+-driven multidrug efflux pump